MDSAVIRKLDRHAETHLHEQAAAMVRRAILDGQLKPGDHLQPAGELAAMLGINRNTALRALRTLRSEGQLAFRRGHGVTVSGTPEHNPVAIHARQLVEFARQHGYRPDEIASLIQTIWAP